MMCAALAVALTACNPSVQTQTHPGADGSDVCEAVETFPIQGGQHLIGEAPPPVPYSSTPPTSGWHASGAFQIAVEPPDEPLSEPQQVSILEAGGVVVTYNGLTPDELTSLTELTQNKYTGRAAVTRYDKLEEGHVALAGWGVAQRCEALDLEIVDGFVGAYADEQPAVPGTVD